MRERGFSLVELAMVLLILAIASAAIALSVRPPLARVGLRGCLDGMAAFDRLTRTFAQEHDRPLRLVLDLAAGRLRRTGEDGREDLGEALRLPAGHRIREVRLADRAVASGNVALSVSARGLTPSYAALVEGPGERRQWVLVAGLTGQVTETTDEGTVRGALEALEARHHAR